jgi:hypothetical protein
MAGQPPPPLFLPSPPFLRHHGTRLYSSGRGHWGRARHGVHGRRGSRRPAPADALRTAAGTGAGDLGDTDSVATPLTPRCGGGGEARGTPLPLLHARVLAWVDLHRSSATSHFSVYSLI